MWEENRHHSAGITPLPPVHSPLLVSVEYQGSSIRLDRHGTPCRSNMMMRAANLTHFVLLFLFSLVVAPKASKKATADNINSKLALVMKSGKVTLGLKVRNSSAARSGIAQANVTNRHIL